MREAVLSLIAVLFFAGCVIAMQNGIHISGQDILFCLTALLSWRLVRKERT